MYIKKSLNIEQAIGNEYSIGARIKLPNSERINVVNIYLPPTASLKKRYIPESEATG
jgi:hypothetical protein